MGKSIGYHDYQVLWVILIVLALCAVGKNVGYQVPWVSYQVPWVRALVTKCCRPEGESG